MSFQVESDVAIPSQRNRYPFAQMKQGQSFAIEGEANSRMVRNAAYQFAKKVNTQRQAAIDEAVALAVKEATEAGGTAEEIEAVKAEVTASATASAPPEVTFTLRQVRTVETNEIALGDDGQPLVKDGKPVKLVVKHYRLWRE
jgi:hypothetical protein